MQSLWNCATRHIAIWQGSTDTCECRIDIQRHNYLCIYHYRCRWSDWIRDANTRGSGKLNCDWTSHVYLARYHRKWTKHWIQLTSETQQITTGRFCSYSLNAYKNRYFSESLFFYLPVYSLHMILIKSVVTQKQPPPQVEKIRKVGI